MLFSQSGCFETLYTDCIISIRCWYIHRNRNRMQMRSNNLCHRPGRGSLFVNCYTILGLPPVRSQRHSVKRGRYFFQQLFKAPLSGIAELSRHGIKPHYFRRRRRKSRHVFAFEMKRELDTSGGYRKGHALSNQYSSSQIRRTYLYGAEEPVVWLAWGQFAQ